MDWSLGLVFSYFKLISIARIRYCQQCTKRAMFCFFLSSNSPNLVLCTMPNACDIPIQRNLGFLQCCRISNGRKEGDPICPCILSITQAALGMLFQTSWVSATTLVKARSQDVLHSTPRSIYDLSTGQHGYVIRQDCLNGFS